MGGLKASVARFASLARGMGELAVLRQPASRVLSVLLWMSPLVVAIFGTKLVKLLLWKPKLPSGVNLGEGVKLHTRDVLLMLADSASLRLLVAVAGIEIVRRYWFRRSSALWTPLVAVIGFLLAKALLSIRDGSLSLGDSYLANKALEEWVFLFSLFRSDFLFVCLFAFAALALNRFLNRAGRPIHLTWHAWLLAPLLIVLGLELAYFRKTGLNGTSQILSFLLKDTVGMRALAGSELDWQSVLCLVVPCLLIPIVPRALSRLFPADGSQRSAAPYGLALLGATTVLLLAAPARLAPVYSRHVEGTLPRLASEVFLKPFRGVDLLGIASQERAAPLLFDYRLSTSAASAPTRNVVIVMMESVRASSTGLYVNDLNNTPFLRELAQKGAQVDQMYAVAPRTSSAWVSILSGIYPGDSDALFLWSSLEEQLPQAPSLPRVLRQHGYRSAFFLPTHLRLQNDEQLAKNFGFDKLVYERLDPQGRPIPDEVFNGSRFERLNYFGYEDRLLLDPIRAWVGQQVGERKPFLLAVMTNAGHYPYQPPKTWKSEEFARPAGGEYNAYLNSIAYIDNYLRELCGIFSEAGILESTLFIILGDHGESFGEHGPRQHLGQAYEEVLRIPAVLFAPGVIEQGTHPGGLRQQIDVFPTILDVLGIKITEGHLPGTSLLQPVSPDRRIFFSGVYEDSTLGMRQRSLKYLYNYDRIPLEMYDVNEDPLESNDIAGTLSATATARAERELLTWSVGVRRALLQRPRPVTEKDSK